MAEFISLLDYFLIFIIGVALCGAFAGVKLDKKSFLTFVILVILSGSLQVFLYSLYDATKVKMFYPLIVHLPIILCLWLIIGKSFFTSIVAVTSVYMLYEPPRWITLFCSIFTDNSILIHSIHIVILTIVAIVSFKVIARYLSKIFNNNNFIAFIAGLVPILFYVIDYVFNVYGLGYYDAIFSKIFPSVLCFTYIVSCVIYYNEFEKKAEAENKKKLIQIMLDQQSKEFEAMNRAEHEMKLLRHDIRHHVNTISLCLENGNIEEAKKYLSTINDFIEGTQVKRFCENDVLNYVLSDFYNKYQEKHIKFDFNVKVENIKSEIAYSALIVNGLENAMIAQENIPEKDREILLEISQTNDKTLLSIKNTYRKKPVFKNGVPVSYKANHGYGTQSICYLTERLGGKYRFSVDGKYFVLQVII